MPDLEFIAGEEIFQRVFLDGLLQATSKVRLATANLKNFTVEQGKVRKSAVSLLRKTAENGARIEVLHGAVPSEPFLHELRTGEPFPKDRFETKFCPRVHLKAVILDDATVYLGTANFTGAGMGGRNPHTRNFEAGIVSTDEAILDSVNDLFDRIWSGDACRVCLRKKNCPEPLEGISF